MVTCRYKFTIRCAKSKYPNRTLTIDTEFIGLLFPVGQEIQGDGSGTVGTIVKRRLDFGQLIVKTTNDSKFNQGETIRYTETDGTIRTLLTTKEEDQYNWSITLKILVVKK